MRPRSCHGSFFGPIRHSRHLPKARSLDCRLSDWGRPCQSWVAGVTYVLIAFVKRRAALPHRLWESLQIIGLTMLEATPPSELLAPPSLRPADRSLGHYLSKVHCEFEWRRAQQR